MHANAPPDCSSDVGLTPNLEDPSEVAALIDHTLLRPDATAQDIERLCAEAREFRFASVCVNPFWVSDCVPFLAQTGVRVCTVIGFPLGATTTATKCFEARTALDDGAQELDMVQNVGALRSGDFDLVGAEIGELAELAHSRNALLKVILETSLLTDGEKVTTCRIASEAGADFVKTSTGFSTSGASAGDVALMRKTVGSRLGVKAAGGIRTLEALRLMVTAGANRIGSSSGVQIVKELHGIHIASSTPLVSQFGEY